MAASAGYNREIGHQPPLGDAVIRQAGKRIAVVIQQTANMGGVWANALEAKANVRARIGMADLILASWHSVAPAVVQPGDSLISCKPWTKSTSVISGRNRGSLPRSNTRAVGSDSQDRLISDINARCRRIWYRQFRSPEPRLHPGSRRQIRKCYCSSTDST